MSSRVQESPFRETEWDQRLDRMLDDLKTTVGPDVSTHDVRNDSSLVSSFRSSSRNGERNSESRGGSRSRSGSAVGIEDGGRVKHTRHEYTPDDNSKVVTEKFEYDTGDTNKTNHYQKKVIKSTYSTFSHKTAGSLDDPPHLLDHAPESPPERPPPDTKGTTSLHNGTNGQQTQQYDADEEEEDYTKSGEVRRIVWRNRYEKTYEGSDSQQAPQPPTVSPGASSWAEPIPLPTPPQLSPREPGVAYIYTYGQDASGSQVKPLPNLNYVQVPGAGSVPPSEGAPSPTPSQLQQGQPIIYHYSYHYNIQPNADGTMPAMAGVPPPALQMAPTTHTLPAGQIVNVQPGTQQSPPEHPHQPGGSNSINYNITSSSVSSNKSTSINNRTETTTHVLPGSTGSPGYPTGGYPTGGYPNGGYPTGGYPNGGYPTGGRPGSPDEPSALTVQPVTGPNGPGEPDGPDGPNGKNISITINKTTTTHTSHSGHPGHPGHPGYPGGQPNCLHETTVSCGPQCSFGPNGINPTKRPVNDSPLTSTPYPTRGRSTSPEPRDGGMPVPPGNVHLNYTNNVYHHSHSDSLERVRRPKHHGLPFPDTSPIKGQANGKIPRKVDDLMTSFTDSEDGPPYPRSGRSHYPEPEDEPLIPANAKIEVRAQADASALAVADAGPDPTKNVCGPAVYYPPGHEMFHETMHTMTLKESNRRGKAKWRMEKQEGYKESASHSETTGEMKMIPVCLPLCCGAACTIM